MYINMKKTKNNNEEEKTLEVSFSDLSNPDSIDRLREWVTFYRRNLDIFVEHYLGIKLYQFQKDILYQVGVQDNVMIIGARAIGKSFIMGLACCAISILYPGTKVVIVAGKLDQGGLIVSEKIEKELMAMSATLRASIKKVKCNDNSYEVTFHNGSDISVVPALDSARGNL